MAIKNFKFKEGARIRLFLNDRMTTVTIGHPSDNFTTINQWPYVLPDEDVFLIYMNSFGIARCQNF